MPVAREELKSDAPAKRRRFALLDKNPDPSYGTQGGHISANVFQPWFEE
jgi:hypothetical protein